MFAQTEIKSLKSPAKFVEKEKKEKDAKEGLEGLQSFPLKSKMTWFPDYPEFSSPCYNGRWIFVFPQEKTFPRISFCSLIFKNKQFFEREKRKKFPINNHRVDTFGIESYPVARKS